MKETVSRGTGESGDVSPPTHLRLVFILHIVLFLKIRRCYNSCWKLNSSDWIHVDVKDLKRLRYNKMVLNVISAMSRP